MSTILEALKKSEQERKLNKLPTLSDMPPPQEPSRLPVSLLILICILLSALLIFVVIQWWQGRAHTPAPVVLTNETLGIEQSAQEVVTADDIVINVISYSSDAGQRFAMINGKMVREGEFVRPGLRVDRIAAKSVVLNLRGDEITLSP